MNLDHKLELEYKEFDDLPNLGIRKEHPHLKRRLIWDDPTYIYKLYIYARNMIIASGRHNIYYTLPLSDIQSQVSLVISFCHFVVREGSHPKYLWIKV
jgi:hypothetical protein